MQPQTVFPADFNGTFNFTNWTDRDFTAKWGNIAYTFPAMKTSPMFIPTLTPLEVQSVRKKFAKELAEREFYTSQKMKDLETMNTSKGELRSFHAAVAYAPADLATYVQRCLEDLPIAKATVEVLVSEGKKRTLRTNDDGTPVTRVLKSKLAGDNMDESLTSNGTPIS